MAKNIMIQGTMSSAGKSLLVTALCRIFRQDGYRVAPFKSQNMALNSYVTPDGLELGRAQAVQAEAAGLECDVRMNPILLKPNSDMGSQLIVNGEVRGNYPAAEYFRMKKSLIPDILSAYESLSSENDMIVIEGAGSPAEINLRADDIVNMGLAELVNAPVLLVGDIDRGGVFAQLYGTAALLRPEERARLEGLVINKFRGDRELLRPGLCQIEDLTGIPVLGVIPWTDADIDDVRITAEVLQPGQFLKTRTGPVEDVIAYWPFAKATNMLEDATGNGNVLTGTGVTVNDGAAVFDGSQSGFATLATLPLYAYRSMTVEWFMKSSMSDLCIVLETSPNYNGVRGAFAAAANDYAPAAIQAGYRAARGGYNVCQLLDVLDGKWHHVALVYDYDAPYKDTVRLYCDGIRTTSRNYVYDGIARHLSERLYIGSRGGNSLPFVGELDDIKITGRALTPAEFMAKRSSPPGVTITIR